MTTTISRKPSWLRRLVGRFAPSGSHFDSGSKRLLLVSHDAQLDGAPLLLLHVAKVLRERFSFELSFLLLGDGPLREDFAKLGTIIDFSRPGWRAPKELLAANGRLDLIRQLRSRDFHHAICNTTVSGTVLPLLHAEGFNTLVLVHELPDLIARLNLSAAAKAIASLANHVVFPAEFVKDQFPERALIDEARMTIRPQGLYRINPFRFDRNAARARLVTEFGLNEKSTIVLGAGPADRRKGVDLFSQVAVYLLSRSRPVEFIWLGDDNKELARDCRAWLSACGFSEKLHFLGLIEDSTKYLNHIAAADVFLLSSREDPFPSVVLDAMAVGIPVVGFESAGGFSVLLAEGAGLLVPFEDRVKMAAAVDSLLLDPSRRNELGAVGRHIVDTRFDFGDYVSDLLQLLGLGSGVPASAREGALSGAGRQE